MPLVSIIQFAFAFADKIPALIAAGVNFYEEYEAHKEKTLALALAKQPPSKEDWDKLHADLAALEASIQAAHR